MSVPVRDEPVHDRPAPRTARPPVPVPTGLLSRLRWGFSDTVVIATTDLRATTRTPELLVFLLIQPVMFVLLFRYVFGGALSGVVPGGDYVSFLLPGIFVQTVVFGSVTTGIGLAYALHQGVIDRYKSLPMTQSAVILGRSLADLVRNTVTVVVMLVVGVAVGFRFDNGLVPIVGGFLLLLFFSYAFSWISAIVGLSVSSVEAAQSGGFIWLFPLTFASSAFVPVESFPSWLRGFAEVNPVTVTVDAVRASFIGGELATDALASVGWCVAILLVVVPLAVRQYKRAATR